MLLQGTQVTHARLIGDSSALRSRVARMLAPLPPQSLADSASLTGLKRAGTLLIPLLLTALMLGALYGERLMRPLLGITS